MHGRSAPPAPSAGSSGPAETSPCLQLPETPHWAAAQQIHLRVSYNSTRADKRWQNCNFLVNKICSFHVHDGHQALRLQIPSHSPECNEQHQDCIAGCRHLRHFKQSRTHGRQCKMYTVHVCSFDTAKEPYAQNLTSDDFTAPP